MGGVIINEDIVIDKSIHKYINSHSAILKVSFFLNIQLVNMFGYFKTNEAEWSGTE